MKAENTKVLSVATTEAPGRESGRRDHASDDDDVNQTADNETAENETFDNERAGNETDEDAMAENQSGNDTGA